MRFWPPITSPQSTQPLIGSFSNRAIFYMAKYEILQLPIVGEALTWTGRIPGPPWRA